MDTDHNKVVKTIYELCLKYPSYKKVRADQINTKYMPIVITSKPLKGGKAETVTYNPDVWVETKKGTIDVFEVWDTQTEAECVEDLLWFALTKNHGYLCIVCLSKQQEEQAKKLDRIILRSLYDEDAEPLAVHHRIIACVTPEIIKRDKKLKTFLYHALEFDE